MVILIFENSFEVSNLKINQEDKKMKHQILYQKANMIIWKIASRAEYRIDEQFQNLSIFGISIVFQMEKFEIFLIFESEKFKKSPIWKITKNSNLENIKTS